MLVGCGPEPEKQVPTPPSQEKTIQTNEVVTLTVQKDASKGLSLMRLGLVPVDPPTGPITTNDYQVYRNDHEDHFKVFTGVLFEGQEKLIPLNNVRHEVPWYKLAELVASYGGGVVGIQISYGLFQGAFLPVYEMVKLDGLEPTVITDSGWIYDVKEGAFKKASDTVRKDLMKHYTDSVRVKRTNAAAFNALDAARDPSSIFFSWNDRFVKLMNDNPGSLPPTLIVAPNDPRYLVITCMAYEANLPPGSPNKEYRHALGLHVAKLVEHAGISVLVDQLNGSNTSDHTMRAMDIGALCPPNCPKRTL